MKHFKVFREKINLNEIKKLREVHISLNESVEATLKAFGISLNDLQLEQSNFIDNSFKSPKLVL